MHNYQKPSNGHCDRTKFSPLYIEPRSNLTALPSNNDLPKLNGVNSKSGSSTTAEDPPQLSKLMTHSENHHNNVFLSEKNRKMPDLSRESDFEQQSSSLSRSSVLNQRYQNVLQFPNYRGKAQGAFEKKFKHCGLELDGEETISILTKFLQPFMNRDIDRILDDYIQKYFMKAFDNIRENINMTAENWSQILKCSISKSVYRQYCSNATIDPFDPVSAKLTDFQYFTPQCKVSHAQHQKINNSSNDVLRKCTTNDSTNPDVVSDTNSEYSDNYEINNLKTVPSVSHICDKFNSYSDSDYYQELKISPIRKRNHDSEKMGNNRLPSHNSVDVDHSDNKYLKINHGTRPTSSHSCIRQTSGNSNGTTFNSHSQFQKCNIYQKMSNNISESLSNPSLSAMQNDNYLSSSHNSIKSNSKNNHYIQTT